MQVLPSPPYLASLSSSYCIFGILIGIASRSFQWVYHGLAAVCWSFRPTLTPSAELDSILKVRLCHSVPIPVHLLERPSAEISVEEFSKPVKLTFSVYGVGRETRPTDVIFGRVAGRLS